MIDWFLAAGVVSAAITLLHVFAGGPTVAAPLLAAKDLEAVAKYVNYYCWHLASISLLLMAAAFGWAWLNQDAWEAAALATIMAWGFSIWGIALVFLKQQSFRDMPQGWFFLPVAILGLCGLIL